MRQYGTALLAGATLLGFACGHRPRPAASSSTVEVSSAALQPASGGEQGAVDPACLVEGGAICWRDLAEPSARDQERLDRQLRVAEQLRVAYRGLAEVEAEHCSDLAARDRALSPFEHHADIRGVVELKRERYLPGQQAPELQTVGARLLFKSVPGLSLDRLQRLVDCHRATHAALGYQMAEADDDPLALQGVSATVRQVDGALAIDVRSMDSETAAEILRRVRAIGLVALNPR